MKTELLITRNGYGFGDNWQLSVTKGKKHKVFYLGQDAKVCYRMLGLSPKELTNEIGSNDLTKKETRQAICDLILDAIGITPENENKLFNLQPWEIASE